MTGDSHIKSLRDWQAMEVPSQQDAGPVSRHGGSLNEHAEGVK